MDKDNQKELKKLFTRKNVEGLWDCAKNNGAMMIVHWQEDGEKRQEAEYVLLDAKKEWGDEDLSRLVSLLVEAGFSGFHSMGKPFVIKENVPLEFTAFVAMHEIDEISQQGIAEGCLADLQARGCEISEEEWISAGSYPHEVACGREIEAVLYKGEEFANKYFEWLLKANSNPQDAATFFNQLKPGFVKDRIGKNPVTVVMEFYLDITCGFMDIVCERWPWIEEYFVKEAVP